MIRTKAISFILLNLILLEVATLSIAQLKKGRAAWEILMIGEVNGPSLPFDNQYVKRVLAGEIQSLESRKKINFDFDVMITTLGQANQWVGYPEVAHVEVKSYGESYRRPNEFNYRISGYGNGLVAYQVCLNKLKTIEDRIATECYGRVDQLEQNIQSDQFAESYQKYLSSEYPYKYPLTSLVPLLEPDHPVLNYTSQAQLLKDVVDTNRARMEDIDSLIQLQEALRDISIKPSENTIGLQANPEKANAFFELHDCRLMLQSNRWISQTGVAGNFLAFWFFISLGVNLTLLLLYAEYVDKKTN
jgi:hypothetical protein